MREVVQIHLLHLAGEQFVFHHHVKLPVSNPTRQIQIGGPHPRPSTIRHRGLGVQHRPIPLKDPHSGFEQWPKAGAGQGADKGNVRRTRYEQPHIHAVRGCGSQGLHVRRSPHKVGISHPDGSPGNGGHKLVKPIDACNARRARHLAEGHLTRRGSGFSILLKLFRCQGRAASRPRFSKRLIDICDGWPLDFHPSIPPRAYPASWAAHPAAVNAESADKTDATINRNHLAMVAAEPAQGAIKPRRVKTPHFHPRLRKISPEASTRSSARPHPVIEQPDSNAFPRLGREKPSELVPHFILTNDVAFKKNALPGSAYGLKPDRIVLSRVFEDAQAVPMNEWRSSSA